MSKTLVQQQFGATAKHYLTSKPHAQGKSLDRLVALAQPQRDWRVLDIATGAGHAAYAFAPHVARVWASDITDEMLAIVHEEAIKRKFTNLRTAHAKAEALPFEDASFDLVTCRIAPHHFDSIDAFLSESARVLKPGATFAMVDNVVPAGTVGDFINAFDRLRDPSHLRAWTIEEWRAALPRHNLRIEHEEQLPKQMEFASRTSRYNETMRALLRAMLLETTSAVKAVLKPEGTGDQLTFQLMEALFIAKRV